MRDFETLLQLGFAGAMAFVLVYIIWKLSNNVISAFRELSMSHAADMKELQKEHREERNQCYASQAKRFHSFDQTMKMMAAKFDCRHRPRG